MVFKKILNHKSPILFNIILFSLLYYWLEIQHQKLQNVHYVLGWSLFCLFLFLASFNLRKKLSVLALGKNSSWYQVHIYVGIWALALFSLHAGWGWPSSFINQALWLATVIILLSGLIGWMLNMLLAPMISSHNERLIFDRIPGYIHLNREKSQSIILKAATSPSGKPLVDYYHKKLLKVFNQPGQLGLKVIGHKNKLIQYILELEEIERYLDNDNKKRLNELKILLKQKFNFTWQYTTLSLLRNWNLFHVPVIWFCMIILMIHIITQYAFQMRPLW